MRGAQSARRSAGVQGRTHESTPASALGQGRRRRSRGARGRGIAAATLGFALEATVLVQQDHHQLNRASHAVVPCPATTWRKNPAPGPFASARFSRVRTRRQSTAVTGSTAIDPTARWTPHPLRGCVRDEIRTTAQGTVALSLRAVFGPLPCVRCAMCAARNSASCSIRTHERPRGQPSSCPICLQRNSATRRTRETLPARVGPTQRNRAVPGQAARRAGASLTVSLPPGSA